MSVRFSCKTILRSPFEFVVHYFNSFVRYFMSNSVSPYFMYVLWYPSLYKTMLLLLLHTII